MFKRIQTNPNPKAALVEQAVRDHQGRLYRIAYGYMGNQQDAMDVVQDALYKALTHLGKLRNEEAIVTWLSRIVATTALDALRKRIRRPTTNLEAIGAMGKEDDTGNLTVKEALHSLPPEDRTIVYLRAVDHLKLQEIALILNMNVNTVKTRLYHSLRRLRVDFEED
ncbi:MAG TPA: RNA polymerase sigma factor [Clostridia bacterium]|nr:RNA polymerase sigma factor [Clostridia bacterium]